VVRVITEAVSACENHSVRMNSTSFQGLRTLVNVKAQAACPMCGHDGWAGGDRLTEIPTPEEPAIEALPFVCTNCGFVRMHAIQPLETLDD
jgi:C4-type Zn-finger protein